MLRTSIFAMLLTAAAIALELLAPCGFVQWLAIPVAALLAYFGETVDVLKPPKVMIFFMISHAICFAAAFFPKLYIGNGIYLVMATLLTMGYAIGYRQKNKAVHKRWTLLFLFCFGTLVLIVTQYLGIEMSDAFAAAFKIAAFFGFGLWLSSQNSSLLRSSAALLLFLSFPIGGVIEGNDVINRFGILVIVPLLQIAAFVLGFWLFKKIRKLPEPQFAASGVAKNQI